MFKQNVVFKWRWKEMDSRFNALFGGGYFHFVKVVLGLFWLGFVLTDTDFPQIHSSN